MINTGHIEQVVAEQLAQTDLFLVEVNRTANNEIEVLIDSDSVVNLERCILLSKAIEEALDREAEDFELTVASAGIGQPLKLLRQYLKLIGKEVEVVLKNGNKLVATLQAATEESITITYSEKVAVEGKKRKELVEKCETLPLSEIKATCEFLSFK